MTTYDELQVTYERERARFLDFWARAVRWARCILVVQCAVTATAVTHYLVVR